MSNKIFLQSTRLSKILNLIKDLSSRHRKKIMSISIHQILLSIRDFLIHNFSIVDVDRQNTRRVTFNENSHSIHRFRF